MGLTSTDQNIATATAVGDIDCDGNLITYTLDLATSKGNPTSVLIEPPQGAD